MITTVLSDQDSTDKLELADKDGKPRRLLLKDRFDRRAKGEFRPLTVDDLDGRTMQGKRINKSVAGYDNFAEMTPEQRLLVLKIHTLGAAIEDLSVQYLNGNASINPLDIDRLIKRQEKLQERLNEIS